MSKFKPTGHNHELMKRHIGLTCRQSTWDQIDAAAKKNGMSKTEFIRQAVIYALDNMEGE
jgi:hypothetical protein